MKKNINTKLLLLWLAIVGVLSACSQEDTTTLTNGNDPVVPTQRDSLTLTTSLPASRVGITDDVNHNFIWDGKAHDIWLLFKSADGTKKAVLKTTLQMPTGTTTASTKLTLKVEKPAAFQGVNGYSVALAMGVSNMDTNGNCTIPQATTINGDYTIPFYMPLTEEKSNTITGKLLRYGSLLGIKLNNTTTAAANFTGVQVYTPGLFSTQGSFNVDATSDAAVTYTATDSYKVNQTYTFTEGKNLNAGSSATVYVWIKPDTTITTATTDKLKRYMFVRPNTDKSATSAAQWIFGQTHTGALKDGLTYPVTPKYFATTLILSEIAYVDVGKDGFAEVYNTTDQQILLDGYYLGEGTSTTYQNSPNRLNIGKISLFQEQLGTVTTTNPAPIYINPNKVIVYSNYATPSANQTDIKNAFGKGANTVQFYYPIKDSEFLAFSVGWYIGLSYNGIRIDAMEFPGTIYRARIRPSTDNTAYPSGNSNTTTQGFSALGKGGTLGVR